MKLDGNEGQLLAPNLMDALNTFDASLLRRYPSTRDLESQIAKRFNVAPAQVLVTAGADDGLLRMCRAYLSPTRNLVLPVPTFEMIERFAQWCFAHIRPVTWEGGAYPVDEVVEKVTASTGLVAVVSPNNPTGSVISADALRELSARTPDCMLMVDCAYAEFADDDITQTALSLPNAVVFRTLSKALGLAGLRVGFAIGPAEVIGTLRAAGMPYPVSAPSIALASEGLKNRMQSAPYIERVKYERNALTQQLNELGFNALSSQGNFVFARVDNALWWRDALAGLGIGVRAWPNTPNLNDAIRITCPGDETEFEQLTQAVKTIAHPEAILFDIDGVLADVSTSYRSCIIQTAERFGRIITNEDIEGCKGAGNANNDWIVTQRLLAQRGVERSLDDIKTVFEDLYWGTSTRDGLFLTESFIGNRDRLVALSKRFLLGAVTGRPRRDALEFLERFNILNVFSAVVTMEDGPAKPDPQPVERALNTMGQSRAWMLGDTRDDVEAARSASVLPIGVLAPQNSSPDTTRQTLRKTGAARVLDEWTEIERYLP